MWRSKFIQMTFDSLLSQKCMTRRAQYGVCMLGTCSQDSTALSNVTLQVRFYIGEVLSASRKPAIRSGIKRL